MIDPGRDLRDFISGEVERVAKRLIGTLMTPIAAQQNGTPASDGHRTFNFTGAGVTVTDDAGNRRVSVYIPGSPSTTATQTVVSDTTAKVQNVSPPTDSSDTDFPNWKTPGYNDSAWAAAVVATHASFQDSEVPSGASSVWDTATRPNTDPAQKLLVRKTFTIASGSQLVSATLAWGVDAYGDIWINGVHYSTVNPPGSGGIANIPVTLTDLIIGTNVIAIEGNDIAKTSSHDRWATFRLDIVSNTATIDSRYELLSHKDAVSGYPSLDAGGLIPTAELGTGSASSATFLRGDRSWQAASTNSVTVDEVDGAPSVTATHVTFPNGTLTDNGGGHVTYTPTLSGGSVYSNYLSADVSLSTLNAYFDGPSLTLPAGRYVLMGAVSVQDPSTTGSFTAKLWDGTTAYTSGEDDTAHSTYPMTIPLMAILSPTVSTTYKISVASNASTGSKIKATPSHNTTGLTGTASYLHAFAI